MQAPPTPSSSFRQRLVHALRGWRWHLATRRRRRADVQHLSSMSDRDLRDLGVGRSELPRIVDRYRA